MRSKLLSGLLSLFGAGPAAAVEEPPFQVVERWKDCELRAYPELVVAETAMAGPRYSGEWSGFRVLADYIFGANARGEKIAMTAPVLETRNGGGWAMRFTMPQGRTLADLPTPKNAKVETKVIPPARLAVIAFSGYVSDADIETKAAELAKCLQAHGLNPSGPPAVAQYDPPWVLGPWRRNEVMVPVD